MAIPETQLNVWTNQGAVDTSEATHRSIREALSAYTWPQGVSFDAYLQGSYRNHTNIRGDSDVDLVVELTSTFYHNVHMLPPDQQRAFHQTYPSASYSWTEFRSDVLQALRNHYGWTQVSDGNKALSIAKQSGLLPAHVVPAVTYWKYGSFRSSGNQSYDQGIAFWTRSDHRLIVNFPKQHYENGVAKNNETNFRFKPAVRMLKNARSYMVDHRQIGDDLAPSYYLECLVYNMPSIRFAHTWEGTLLEFIIWFNEMWAKGSIAGLLCQNGKSPLFGDQPEQWTVDKANHFADQLWTLEELEMRRCTLT